jgi:hypothetical protein
MDRRTLDWNLWMPTKLEAFVDPHTSINVGRRIALYTVSVVEGKLVILSETDTPPINSKF